MNTNVKTGKTREIEVWVKLIKQGAEFEVSNTGRVKSLSRTVTYKTKNGTIVTRPKKQTEYVFTIGKNGYYKTAITVNSKKISFSLHSWVAEAFLGPKPIGMVINHKNGDKTDNRVENLEYCTNSQNIQHAFDNGLNRAKGVNHHNTKLNVYQVEFIKENLGKMPQRKIAAICGVGEHIVSNIKLERTFKQKLFGEER